MLRDVFSSYGKNACETDVLRFVEIVDSDNDGKITR